MIITQVPVLGVQISAVNLEIALNHLEYLLTEKSPNYICVTPAHSIMDCVNNPALFSVFNNAGMVTPDGMAVVWILQLKGCKQVGRVYGPDLMLALCEKGIQNSYRHYFYGGAPGTTEKLKEKLVAQFPDLQVVGMSSPPFRQMTLEEDEAVISQINLSKADIIWVGISSPKQEMWMQQHLGKIEAPLMIGVGAAFDFLSGVKPQAPKWMQRIGLEWLFRLASEPKRLFPRYRQYPKFIFLLIGESLGIIKIGHKKSK